MKNYLKNCFLFTIIFLKELRLTGFELSVGALIVPSGILLIFALIGAKHAPLEVTHMYIAGAIFFSVCNVCFGSLCVKLGSLRDTCGLEDYTSFPIQKSSIAVGLVSSTLLTVIPFFVLLLILGVVLYSVKFNFHFLFFVSLFLILLIFTNMAFIIALQVKNFSSLATLLVFFILFGTPIFYPIDALPSVLRVVHGLLPFFNGVEAIRKTMYFEQISEVFHNIIVLAIYALVSIALGIRVSKLKKG